MLGFDPLSMGTLLILAAAGAKGCAMPQPTQINVRPITKEVRIDDSKPSASLQGVHIDTLNPYSFEGISVTQGFMKGGIRMQPQVKVDYRFDEQTKTACLWYELVEIEIELDPTIVIAKEVSADKCMRKAVLDHEMKHVMADRKIVNKYAQIMGKKVHAALAERGFLVGPVPYEQAQSVVNRMHETVQQITDLEFKKMDIERMEVQRAIDNLEEYNRVSALCPKYVMPEAAAAMKRR